MRLGRRFAHYCYARVMQSVQLPKTDIRVSRLSFGTAGLHHLATRRSRMRLLSAAADAGFRHFDTSPLYGYGIGETELGRLSRQCDRSITIATKVGLYPPLGAGSNLSSVWFRKIAGKLVPRLSAARMSWVIAEAQRSLENSLLRLNRDCVDVLFMHEPSSDLYDADEWLNWFERQRDAGKIRAWGLAGPSAGMTSLLRSNHPLANVLQVRDGLANREADVLAQNGRNMQFTYGYLSEHISQKDQMSPAKILSAALARNRTGSIVVSTRKLNRVAELVEMASEKM